MTMRFVVSLILLLAGITTAAAEGIPVREKLLREIGSASSPQQKVAIYRNLADLCSGTLEEYTYLQKLCSAARECEDTPNLLEALSELAYLHIRQKQLDSVNHYMQLLQSSSLPEQTESHLCYLRLRLFDNRVMGGDMQAFATESKFLESRSADKNSPYIRIEQAFVSGKALYVNGKYREALPYLLHAERLSTELQGKEDAQLHLFVKWCLATTYNAIQEEHTYLALVEELVAIRKALIEKYYTVGRPYYPADLYSLFYYAALFSRIELLSEEKIESYMAEVQQMDAPRFPIDRYNLFWIRKHYYRHKGKFDDSIVMLDSLLSYTRKISPGTVPNLLQEKATLCQRAGQDRMALDAFKEFVQCMDSLAVSNRELQMSGMQQLYKIDTLNFENARLTNTRKHMQAILLGSAFLLGIVICSYLYYGLRKTRRTQHRLQELSVKAEQSEHSKTQFINQMCHEIRTPLNVISGFSQVVADPSLDGQTHDEICDVITHNSARLGSMIEQMLTVAGLSGEEEAAMECTPVYIEALCRQELGKLQRKAKKTIAYSLKLPRESITVNVDEKLLAMSIYSLLDNAEKFTLRGQITLTAELDKWHKIVRISVTDTGCGIPADKREFVFERFTKLDSFSEGNGLGLYLSRLIVERHGGRVFIDPEYTNGTHVVIELPWGGEFSDSSTADN